MLGARIRMEQKNWILFQKYSLKEIGVLIAVNNTSHCR